MTHTMSERGKERGQVNGVEFQTALGWGVWVGTVTNSQYTYRDFIGLHQLHSLCAFWQFSNFFSQIHVRIYTVHTHVFSDTCMHVCLYTYVSLILVTYPQLHVHVVHIIIIPLNVHVCTCTLGPWYEHFVTIEYVVQISYVVQLALSV